MSRDYSFSQHFIARFGNRFHTNFPLKTHCTARVGGNARWFVTVNNKTELQEVLRESWELGINSYLMGSGSNVLFSDDDYDGIVIQNQAKQIILNESDEAATIWAESGASIGLIARKAALAEYEGLEWASGIPGTLGGAVYGNAGAHGGDISSVLHLAEILQPGKESVFWQVEDFAFAYRSSTLKRGEVKGIVLSASLKCKKGDPQLIKEKMETYNQHRRRSQPPGASMGSMFKNPPGDYAGRLIEASGLKGFSVGGVKVSEVHANFFVNSDQATAMDYYNLIRQVQQKVKEKFNVDLELEIELVGFNNNDDQGSSSPERIQS